MFSMLFVMAIFKRLNKPLQGYEAIFASRRNGCWMGKNSIRNGEKFRKWVWVDPGILKCLWILTSLLNRGCVKILKKNWEMKRFVLVCGESMWKKNYYKKIVCDNFKIIFIDLCYLSNGISVYSSVCSFLLLSFVFSRNPVRLSISADPCFSTWIFFVYQVILLTDQRSEV